MTTELFIGLMSGTSMDGIDAVLGEFADHQCRVLASTHRAYPGDLRDGLRNAALKPDNTTLRDLAHLDVRVGEEFARAAQAVAAGGQSGDRPVRAIGSHGQTVLHAPRAAPAYTVQLGDPATIAVRTGLTVVADFRRGDLALGGQGAPLVPGFHRFAFGQPGEWRAAVNIGGIANVTIMSPAGDVLAFDTGPGNTLLDGWIARHRGDEFDRDGSWAASGKVQADLLARLLGDSFFSLAPPKSTGTDYFNLSWIDRLLDAGPRPGNPADVQATLAELTARSVATALRDYARLRTVALCGGGANNLDLQHRLARLLPHCVVTSTATWGLDPRHVEAMAFAWLARERLAGRPSNVPEVTGARGQLSLGGIYLPPVGGWGAPL